MRKEEVVGYCNFGWTADLFAFARVAKRVLILGSFRYWLLINRQAREVRCLQTTEKRERVCCQFPDFASSTFQRSTSSFKLQIRFSCSNLKLEDADQFFV